MIITINFILYYRKLFLWKLLLASLFKILVKILRLFYTKYNIHHITFSKQIGNFSADDIGVGDLRSWFLFAYIPSLFYNALFFLCLEYWFFLYQQQVWQPWIVFNNYIMTRPKFSQLEVLDRLMESQVTLPTVSFYTLWCLIKRKVWKSQEG